MAEARIVYFPVGRVILKMPTMRNAIETHRERYGIVWLAAIVSAVVALGGNSFAVYKAWDSKADKDYVHSELLEFGSKMDMRFTRTEQTLIRVLGGQIAAELDRLAGMRCRSPSARDLVETIRRLKDEYFIQAGRVYVNPTCEELGVGG